MPDKQWCLSKVAVHHIEHQLASHVSKVHIYSERSEKVFFIIIIIIIIIIYMAVWIEVHFLNGRIWCHSEITIPVLWRKNIDSGMRSSSNL